MMLISLNSDKQCRKYRRNDKNVEMEGNLESIIIVSLSEMELGSENRVGCAIIEILEPNTTVFGSRIYILVGSEKGGNWHI